MKKQIDELLAKAQTALKDGRKRQACEYYNQAFDLAKQYIPNAVSYHDIENAEVCMNL